MPGDKEVITGEHLFDDVAVRIGFRVEDHVFGIVVKRKEVRWPICIPSYQSLLNPSEPNVPRI